MVPYASMSKEQRQAKAEELFLRADKQQDLGNLKSGFRLLLLAAKLGNESAQLNLGYTYDTALGVRRNRSAAMFWYLKSYRQGRGPGCAAVNIGTIFRDEHNYLKAIQWFQRAIQMGDVEANLELAKIYFQKPNDRNKAIKCLQKVLTGTPPINVSEDAQEEALILLEKIRSEPNKHARGRITLVHSRPNRR